MDIRSYLVSVAEEITEKAPALPAGEPWEAWQKRRREQFWHMLGIDRHMNAPRTDLNVQITRTLQRDGYRIDVLSYESLPGLKVEANLYVPDAPGPHPGLLYVCGHSALQKASHYQQHARRYAQLGFVTLIVDTVQNGDVRGYHHGTHRYGWFHWISRGYTSAGIETWNGIRGLDLLSTLPEVDAERLGVTGTSGGGAMSWWIAAADERVRAASPSCGTATIASHVRERTIDGHCDCMFPVNLYGFSLIDMAALIAPRPVLIVSADRDTIFTIDSIHDFHERLARVYEHLGVPENLELFTFRAPHSYQEPSRRKTFQWLLRHLKGKDLPLDEVADIDEHIEEPEVLSVYPNGLPKNNRSTTVHDWFVPQASAPVITTPEDLEKERGRVVRALHETTLHAFPDPLPAPAMEVTQEWLQKDGDEGLAFTFATDGGWRLGGVWQRPAGASTEAPTIVQLLHPEQTRWLPAYVRLAGAPAGWSTAALAPRGTGDSAWSPGLQWHLRRAAALTGRTIASMRLLDTLQGLKALRTLPHVNPDGLYLAARGEMAVVALYAALLDEKVRGVILFDPPATHNAPGNPDGTGPCLEMLGVLQITDLPYVAGLLWPRELVFVGGRPESYGWAEELYARLGEPGGWWGISELRYWNPAPSSASPAGASNVS